MLPLPPRELRFMGESDELFLQMGEQFVEDLRAHARLSDTSSVVDVGCAYGRFAHGLLRWEAFRGRYTGFDILPKHVAWCRDVLEPVGGGRFTFRHVDIRNDRYNQSGKLSAADVRFPVRSRSADVVLLTSVFTHMYPQEIEHYLDEIRRILRPAGRALVTWFLLNESWAEGDAAGRSKYPMPHRLNDFARYMDVEDPLRAIGYAEDWVLEQVRAHGLRPTGAPLLGTWCGRAYGYRGQDIVILERPRAGLIAKIRSPHA